MSNQHHEFKFGDRIRLLKMENDPDPLPRGATGTINGIFRQPDWMQYSIAWDAPHQSRQLLVCTPYDEMELVESIDSRLTNALNTIIEYAARQLAQGWSIELHLFNDATGNADMQLIDPNGDSVHNDCDSGVSVLRSMCLESVGIDT